MLRCLILSRNWILNALLVAVCLYPQVVFSGEPAPEQAAMRMPDQSERGVPVPTPGREAMLGQQTAGDGSYGSAYDILMRRVVERHYADSNRLEKEYMALKQDRDKNADRIFRQLRGLEDVNKSTLAKLDGELKDFDRIMTASKIARTDKRYVDGMKSIRAQMGDARAVFNSGTAGLRRLYQLNTLRYNELLKIHEARQNLLDRRYSELRDLVAEQAGLETRRAAKGLTPLARKALDLRQAAFEDRERQATGRYDNSAKALNDVRKLTEQRIKSQRDYLIRHEEIMQRVALAGGNLPPASGLAAELNQLRERRDADEREYLNDFRYLRERLALQQFLNRELGRLDNLKIELEDRWLAKENDLVVEGRELDARLADKSITPEQEKSLEEARKKFEADYGKAQSDYAFTIALLGERRDLTEKGMSRQFAYLKDRSDLRARIAASRNSGANLAKYRAEMDSIEAKRLDNERETRDGLMALIDKVPEEYRESPWLGGPPEERRQRIEERHLRTREAMNDDYVIAKKATEDLLAELTAKMDNPATPAADKPELGGRIAELVEMLAVQNRLYMHASAVIDARQKLEEARFDNLEKYLAERAKLLKESKATLLSYEQLDRYNKQIRDLDQDWDNQEQAYLMSARPLRDLFPADGGMAAGWERSGYYRYGSDMDGEVPTALGGDAARVDVFVEESVEGAIK